VSRIDEAEHTVLDKIPDVDRVRHGCRHAAGKLLYEWDAGNNSRIFFGAMGAHERDLRPGMRQPQYHTAEPVTSSAFKYGSAWS
jgi:hypothetical protein